MRATSAFIVDVALASGQPLMDLLCAPIEVVDLLAQRLEERAAEQEKRDRQTRLRDKLRQSMGR